MKRVIILLSLVNLLFLAGCKNPGPASDEQLQHYIIGRHLHQATQASASTGTPPQPPLHENFEGTPQLSLFPRIGSFRPETGSKDLPFWRSYIEHLLRTSGPVRIDRGDSKVCWSMRAVRGLGSVGFFSPLVVEPGRRYRVSLELKTDLADEAKAGVGILEFDSFLWIGEQYPKSIYSKHILKTIPGVSITGKHDWQRLHFTFTTGPETRMVHLVMFREGAHDRQPVYFDNIDIRPVPGG